jgi:hypothetical protein
LSKLYQQGKRAGGAQALCEYFCRMQNQNSGFYYVMDIDDDCKL